MLPPFCLTSVIEGAATPDQSALAGRSPPVVSVTEMLNTLAPLFISAFSGDTTLYVPAVRPSYVRAIALVPVTELISSLLAMTELSAALIRPTIEELEPPVLLILRTTVAVPVTVNSIAPVKALSSSIAFTLPSLLVLKVTLPTDLK